MTLTRREWCLMAGALTASREAVAGTISLTSKVLPYDEMPVHRNGQNESRAIVAGELHDGFQLEVHQTRLAPGGMPHPPHHHLHEEMFLIREGTLEVTISGKSTRLGPGSVAFVGPNDEHGIRNAGTTVAEYFVVALGNDT